MTVREVVSANVGRQIKLGFGSSFVYCDTISEKTEGEIAIISDLHLKQFGNNLKTAEIRLAAHKAKGEQKYVAEMVAKQKREYPRCNEEHFAKVFKLQYHEIIERYEAMIVSIHHAIDDFVSFLDADVLETYESQDEDALICKSGDNKRVNGSFWCCSEYRDCRKRNKYM